MWFYFIIFLLILFVCFLKIKQEAIVFWGLVVLLFLMAAFSGTISKDHENYIKSYIEVNEGVRTMEASFIIISLAVKKIFNNPLWLFIIYALLGVSLKLIAIRRMSEFWIFSILIYFSYYFFLHEMTQIRAGVSTAFVMLSIPSIYERNLKSFLFYAGAGIFFHFSALILLPLYLLRKDKIELWFFFLIPFGFLLYFGDINVASLIKLINLDIISRKHTLYLQIIDSQRINVFNVLMLARYAFCTILLWKWIYLREKNPYSVILIKFYIISCFVLLAFADIPAVAFRLSEVLAVSEIILIPYIIYLFKIRSLGKIFVALVGVLLLCLILLYEKLVLGFF